MSSLPVTSEYLMAALQDGYTAGEIRLSHFNVAELALPTGQLVACDPFVEPSIQPFKVSLPRGSFPVVLSIAFIKTDQRVAFATLRFTEKVPSSWEMLTVGEQDTSTLKDGECFGYGVDSGTGCFMDLSTSRALNERMAGDDNLYETLGDEMDKTYKNTWSWLNTPIGAGNLVAFSSGYGDGFYATYAGRDSEGSIAVVVTDFGVLPSKERTEKPARKTVSSLAKWLFGKN